MPIVSICLFVFGGALLIYALIAFLTKKIIVPIHMSSSVKNVTKEYARKFSNLIAFIALAPIIGGITGLFIERVIIPIIIFFVLFIILLIVGIKTIMKEGKKED